MCESLQSLDSLRGLAITLLIAFHASIPVALPSSLAPAARSALHAPPAWVAEVGRVAQAAQVAYGMYPQHEVVRLGLDAAATFGVAWISYAVIEAPCLRLKERFRLARRQPPADPARRRSAA